MYIYGQMVKNSPKLILNVKDILSKGCYINPKLTKTLEAGDDANVLHKLSQNCISIVFNFVINDTPKNRPMQNPYVNMHSKNDYFFL